MVSISLQDNLTKQDAKRMKILYNQLRQTIKNKNALEGLNMIRLCAVNKCKKDIENMLQTFINECNINNKSKACKFLSREKEVDSKKVQNVIDSNFIELYSDLKNRVVTRESNNRL